MKFSANGWPVIALDDFVPASIVRDVNREVGKLFALGAKGILIQIPIEDLAKTLDAVMASGRVTGPFEPRLCGWPVAGWEQGHVAVMGQKPKEPRVRIYDATGKEHEVP